VMVDTGGQSFRYNKPVLVNGNFFAAPSLQWLEQMGLVSQGPHEVHRI